VHLRLKLRNPQIFSACGSACGSNTAVRLHVGDVACVFGRQVPDRVVIVLIHVLGRPAGTAAGGFHHLRTHSHFAFLIAQAIERGHDVVVPDPEIGLEPQRLPIER